MDFLGNRALLEQPLQGFLCPRATGSWAILPCLDWAVRHAHDQEPIVSTFHSELEASVLELLTDGTCPIIMVLGRKLYRQVPPQLQKLLDADRLLMVSLSEAVRISRASAYRCNQYVCQHAERVTFGFLAPESSLYTLYEDCQSAHKKTEVLASRPS